MAKNWWVRVQAEFLRDIAKLVLFADSLGFDVSSGEFQRPRMMQEYYVKTGRSTTMKSDHLYRRAADLYFFRVDPKGNRHLTYDLDELRPILNKWKSLNPKNYCGADWKNFKDVPHFGRKR